MAIPRTSPVPVPWEELQKAQGYLAPQYGSQVWQDGEHRVLLVRVPHPEPDLVNDIEEAVEYLSPGDAMDLTHCLLIGGRRMEAVYTQPVRDLMAARVAFDREQCALLRPGLPPNSFKTFVSQKDPRRLTRLAIRLGRASVNGLEDADVDALVELVGPELAAGKLDRVRAVYLIADRDDVRLDPAVFLPDLRRRFEDDDRRRRMVEEAERRHREVRERRENARRDLLRDLERRFGEADRLQNTRQRVARAPLRRPDEPAWEPAPEEVVRAPPPAVPLGPPLSAPGALSPAPAVAAPLAPASALLPSPALPPAASVAVPSAAPERPSPKALMVRALESAGYDVLDGPAVEGHRVDLAAERAEGHPQRILVQFHDRVTVDAAEGMLRAARDLGADLVVGVADAADPEAQRRLVATKGRWVAPRDIQRMGL